MAKLYLFKQKVYQMDDFIRRPPCFVDSEDEKFYCKNIKDKTDCQKCKKAQFYHVPEMKIEPCSIAGADESYVLYANTTDIKIRRWVNYFNDISGKEIFHSYEYRAQKAGLIFRGDGRYWAIIFGHGNSLINSDHLESMFGLKTMLNTCDLEAIKSISKKNIARNISSKHNAVGVTKYSDLNVNNIFDDLQIMSNLKAKMNKKYVNQLSLGKAYDLQAAEYLELPIEYFEKHIQESTFFRKFPKIFNELYRKETYKERFSFIDKLQNVNDEEIIDFLNNEILQNWNEILFTPQIDDYDTIVHFKFTPKKSEPLLDFNISQFLKSKKIVNSDSDANLNKLKSATFHVVLQENGEERMEQLSFYKSISFVATHNDKEHILYEGNWYSINETFAQEIDQKMQNIKMLHFNLPSLQKKPKLDQSSEKQEKGEDEEEYNKAFAHRIGNAYHSENFDRQLIDGIEICDTFLSTDDNLYMIFTKKYNYSRSISYLIHQVLVSLSKVLTEKSVRDQVENKMKNAILKKRWQEITGNNIDKDHLIIVINVISKNHSEIASLPKFSKILLADFIHKAEEVQLQVRWSFSQIE